MKKLLVIRLGALGDLLHAGASVQAVKAANPELEIHWLTSPTYATWLGTMPGVDRVWPYDKAAGWGGLWRLAQQLRAVGFDGVVNLHPSFKTGLLTQLIGPCRTVVYRKEKLKLKGQAQRALTRRHAVADFYAPFMQLMPGQPAGVAPLHWPQAASPLVKLVEQRWIGLIPGVGAKRANRAWEPAAYADLMRELLKSHPTARILLMGGPDETTLAEALQMILSDERVENHCGRHDIAGTAALLAQCDLVIGGDTGPLHLAAAVGAPLVAIFGPTSLQRTGPLGKQVIKKLTPPDDLACWPCELAECPLTGREHLACMKKITQRQVLLACQEVLG